MTTKQDNNPNMESFQLNKAMIFECFDAWTYTKGERYFRNEMVKSWETKKNGIDGKVKGNYSPYYRTKLRIKHGSLVGTCSCPVGVHCKHCVALALQWIKDKNSGNKETKITSVKKLRIIEGDTLEEELGESNKPNKTPEIPLGLKQNSRIDGDSYLKLLPRKDLENLANFFVKEFTKTRKITIFTPQFISTIWNSCLTQLDDDFNESKMNHITPVSILKQITDEKAIVQYIKVWFEGYVDLINQIRDECRVRGMLEKYGEELYGYYKSIEYEIIEEEFFEESNERSEYSYNSWDYDDYYLEPYNQFDLDVNTLKSYIEGFFKWLFAPVEDICDYILYIHKCHLFDHQDYLIKEKLQWIKDLKPPTEELGIDPDKISALLDLKSMIATKLSFLTNFSNMSEKLNHLYSIFIHNPSQRNAEIIWSQLHRIQPTEQDFQYFIRKILDNFEKRPRWEKYDLLKKLILKYQPEFIGSLLKVSIDSLWKAQDTRQILEEILNTLEKHPVDLTLTLESSLKQASLKVSIKSPSSQINLYRKTIDWLMNYYNQKKMFDRAFIQLKELATKHPKMFEFKDYKILRKILPSLPDQFDSEYESVISLVIQKGTKKVSFRILLALEKYDEACDRINNLSSSRTLYSHYDDTQWGAITRLIPHISSISDKNKDNMIKILKAQIKDWISRSSRNRPDASIAEAISQIRTIYLSFDMKDGDMLWKKWFKSFSNKHWRLRNLRSALNKKGLELRKQKS